MEITIYLTDECNFYCSYCYEGKKKSEYLDELKIKKILTYINNNGTGTTRITFHGGEPLLNKDGFYKFFEILHRDYKEMEKKLKFNMTTNGSLLDEHTIDFLCKENIEVSISIDGDLNTHLLNRHVKNGNTEIVYRNIINNLGMFLIKNENVGVRMTITPNNVCNFLYNIKLFLELGVKKIFFGIDQTTTWDSDSLAILDKEFINVISFYLKKRDLFKLPNIDGWINTFVIGREVRYCNGGTQGHLVVAGDGSFYPCTYVANMMQWKIGDLDEGYKNKKFNESVKNSIKPNKNNCKMAFLCLNAKCGFLNYITTGYLNQCNEQGCNIQKVIYKHIQNTVLKLYQNKDSELISLLNIIKSYGKEYSNAFIELVNRVDGEAGNV